MSYGGTSARKTAAVSCGQNRPLPIFFRALHSAFCAGHRLSSAESAGVAAYSDPAENREDVQQTEYFNQHQVECVKQAAALLTQELTVRRTIEQLAQEVGLSPTALKSCFKGIYGSSVYAYQKEYRLQLAQKLLLETDCTVAEIAHRVGYENPNKFSSAFREAAGMTPTEYRKMRPIG